MNIDDLPPGIELDKTIAHIMGWVDLIEHNGVLWKEDPSICECAVPWKPSKNIADAWDVVEWVRSELIGDSDYSLMLVDDHMEDGRYAYGCRFIRNGKWSVTHSMPLAICHAALKAMQIKNKE
jgi:hypothetical protein